MYKVQEKQLRLEEVVYPIADVALFCQSSDPR
jgi:hypothetical protein